MVDFLGNEIKVGDPVVIVNPMKTSKRFVEGIVCGFTKCMVKVEYYDDVEWFEGTRHVRGTINKDPDGIIVISK